jgi:hypothetical protein
MNTFLPRNNDSTFQKLKPAFKKLGVWIKENWFEIVALCFAAAIVEDVDDVSDYSHMSATIDVMTAAAEGVI